MRRFACAAALLLAVAASPVAAQTPAATPVPPAAGGAAAADAKTPGDPYEKFNRGVWGFNRGVDKVVIKPVTIVYRTVTPKPARRGLSRVFANLNEPWSFINNLLQGKVGRAFTNLERFVVNTTIGVGGLADHATELGIRPAPEDFGQTLAVWGVRSSAYLVLPLLGPSTVRDGVGTGVGFVADPYPQCLRRCTDLSYVQRLGIQATEVISIRSDLIDSGADDFLDSSLDPYAAARSAYLQSRQAAIADSDDVGGTEAPAELDPTAADTPPARDDATAPAAPEAAPPATAPPPTGDAAPTDATAAPRLSLNLANFEG